MSDDTDDPKQANQADPSTTQQSGGISMDAREVNVRGDMAARDKVEINVGPGGTVVWGNRWSFTRRSVGLAIGICFSIVLLIGVVLIGTNRPPETPPVPDPLPVLTAVLMPLGQCPPALGDEFYTALTGLLASQSITVSVQRGTTPVSSAAEAAQVSRPEGARVLVLWGRCAGDQVTYHLEILLLRDEVAEPLAVEVTWMQTATSWPARVLGAVLAYYSGQPERAAAWLKETAGQWSGLNPGERATLEFLLGNAWLLHRGQAKAEALAQYQLAEADFEATADPPGDWRVQLRNNRGLALLVDRRSRDAESEFDTALADQPDALWPLFNRSLARAFNRKVDLAQEDCHQLYLQTGDEALDAACRAQVLFWQSDYAGALPLARKAIDLDPRYGTPYFYAGVASCNLKNQPAAEAWLNGFMRLARHPVLRPFADLYLASMRTGQPCGGQTVAPVP